MRMGMGIETGIRDRMEAVIKTEMNVRIDIKIGNNVGRE